MKCPNCGAEIGAGKKFCDNCGSQISYDMQREQEQLNKKGCPQCGSSNVTFNREKQGEVRGKKGTAVVRRTVGVCKDCGYTWYTAGQAPAKKSNTWLWVLGWIFIFPVPLTILMLRKKDMHPALKYGIIAVGWIVYLLIGLGGSGDKKTEEPTVAVEETTQDKVIVKEPAKEEDTDTEVMDVTLAVEPNVNADDGTVLFGVTTNLPEGTELMITVFNDSGYMAQDKTVVLAQGTGYTSEFSDNGAGLKGDYTVRVSMSLPSLQKDSVRAVIGEKGEKIGGQYVEKSDIGDSNVVSGEFKFTF